MIYDWLKLPITILIYVIAFKILFFPFDYWKD